LKLAIRPVVGALAVLVGLTGCTSSVTLHPHDAGTDGEVVPPDGALGDGGDVADVLVLADGVDDRGVDDGGEADGSGTLDGAPASCQYVKVHERPGAFHFVTEAAPMLSVSPLAAGQGFNCMRVEFTMQTVDNLTDIDAAYEGCPIFSHVAGVAGGTATGKNLGGAFFRFLRMDCTPRHPGAVQLEAYNPTQPSYAVTPTASAWDAGLTYRMVLEVTPSSSSLTLAALDATPLGPRVELALTGITVDMTREPLVRFGLDRVYDAAYFPYFGATYSDLEIFADVAS
jgi:hypothetical protein